VIAAIKHPGSNGWDVRFGWRYEYAQQTVVIEHSRNRNYTPNIAELFENSSRRMDTDCQFATDCILNVYDLLSHL